MTDAHEAKQATPPETLLAELLDSRIPKSEREHAAKREIERLRAERDEARAERDAMAKQGETFRRLVDACKLLSSEAEEYEFDDGMGRGAMLDYWHEFDHKLDAALAQIERERSEQAQEG